MIAELHQIFTAQNGNISKDTRSIKKGAIYFALKGANFNGNQFTQKAFDAGAAYAVVDEKVEVTPQFSDKVITVDHVLQTLQNLARYHRKQFNIPIIGITGSNGKTTTKELVSTVLSQQYNIIATEGNLNNHIGVPLTLLKITNATDIAIIEMGANQPGDIHELVNVALPTHGLITNIGKAHLEGFGGFEGVLQTKRALYDFIMEQEGTVFYNDSEKTLVDILKDYGDKISYGVAPTSDVYGTITKATPTLSFQWSKEGQIYSVDTHLFGNYNFFNIMAALSIGNHFKCTPEQMNQAIATYIPKNNRSQVEKTAYNTVIWDAYNANPTSMSNAVKSLSEADDTNKLAILGDMKEVGVTSTEEHQNIVALLEKLNIEAMLVGEEFSNVQSEFQHFKDTSALVSYIQANPIQNRQILVKGSRSIQLEKLNGYI